MKRTITKEKFIEMYLDPTMTISRMKKELKVSRTTITNWANKFNLPSKAFKLVVEEDEK